MEKKLEKLLKNKISKTFVAKLEDKLICQYKPKTSQFMLWRYSFAGLAFIVLIAISIVLIKPFAPQNNIIANALEYYKNLEQEQGIYYIKSKYSISGQEGLETEFGSEYTEETWVGDNGEVLVKIHGNKDGIRLKTADGKYFSNYSFDNHAPSDTISCLITEQRGYIQVEIDNKMENILRKGRTTLTINNNDFSQVEVSSSVIEDTSEDATDEYLPERNWIQNMKIPMTELQNIEKDSRFEEETVIIDGDELYKITIDRSKDEIEEMYFDSNSLALKKIITYPKDHPDYKFSTEFFEEKNIKDVSPEIIFSPENYQLKEVYEEVFYVQEQGCYYPDGKKMSKEEESQLLKKLPNSTQKEIEDSKIFIKKRMEYYKEFVEKNGRRPF